MAFDKLLESVAPRTDFSGAGTYYGDWVYVGPDKNATWRMTIGGDITGTNPTLDVTIEGSTDGSGSADATLGTFTQVTSTEQVGYITGGGVPRPEVPGAWAAFATAPTRQGSTQYPWQRVKVVLGGTTPVYNDVSVDVFDVQPHPGVPSGGATRDTTVYLA